MPRSIPAPGSVQRPQGQEDMLGEIPPPQPTLVHNQPVITRSILEEILRDPLQSKDDSSDHQPWFNSCNNAARPATRASMPFQVQSLPSRQNQSYQIRGSIPWPRGEGSQDISCQIQSVVQRKDFEYELVEPIGPTHAKEPKPLHQFRDPRRYRRWRFIWPSRDAKDRIVGSAVDELSDWEVRMMERLDRKLLWLFNEFTPGKRPYHFALLANHWLNRETWYVYDPVSRIPTDARRMRGDPRFSVPYPRPVFSPRPKYPTSKRKRAQTPRIDSWRAAVNKQRKVSGVRDAIRTITLYDESGEEPPDGHIDPGCWVLPKPPQGFEMSTAQKNAWYEGGAGWQEKLDDWQQVPRGYRVRKAIHEGRVNQNRVKEVAAQVNQCCRTASENLTPSHDLGKTRAPNFLVS
ncbi:hypothetical protein E8E15_010353 [Penicillium rubens]|nr:hypothetical protein E8E15_010353 [Penicillium rubens]